MPTITIDPYDSKTGKGTLSYYAREYGTTVDELAKSNNIQNPDLIQAGGSLVVPDSGVQRTTTAYRQDTQKNMQTFDEQQQQRLQEQQQQKDQEANKTTDDKVVDPFAGVDDENKDIQNAAALQIKEIENNYKSIAKFADQAHRDLIDATTKLYSARIAKMEDANKRLVATKGVSNMRQGRARYTPELAEGILTDEEQAGQERIATLEGEMLKAIAEADSAKADGDMNRFNTAFDQLNKVKSNMDKQIKENFDRAIAQDKAIRDQQKAQRDAVKQEFDLMIDRAKTAAPALADKMLQFTSSEDQTAFLEAYSARTGVDMDILLGEIQKASSDAKYKDLQIQNIQNQMSNRNANTALAYQREARLSTEKKKEDEVLPETQNVMQGITNLRDLDEKTAEKTKAELAQYGFYDNTPPQWFVEEYETQAKELGDNALTSGEIKMQWDTYRKERGII